MGVCVSDIFFGGHFSERSRTEKYNTKEIVILLNIKVKDRIEEYKTI